MGWLAQREQRWLPGAPHKIAREQVVRFSPDEGSEFRQRVGGKFRY